MTEQQKAKRDGDMVLHKRKTCLRPGGYNDGGDGTWLTSLPRYCSLHSKKCLCIFNNTMYRNVERMENHKVCHAARGGRQSLCDLMGDLTDSKHMRMPTQRNGR